MLDSSVRSSIGETWRDRPTMMANPPELCSSANKAEPMLPVTPTMTARLPDAVELNLNLRDVASIRFFVRALNDVGWMKWTNLPSDQTSMKKACYLIWSRLFISSLAERDSNPRYLAVRLISSQAKYVFYCVDLSSTININQQLKQVALYKVTA